MKATRDLTGKRVGRWTVLHRLPRITGQRLTYRCRCDCGTESSVSAKHLVSGQSRSCGCLQRERTSQVAAQRRPWARRNLKGQQIGDLLVLKPGPPLPWKGHPLGATSWICRCRCGRTVVIATRNLVHRRDQRSDCGHRHLLPSVERTTPVAPDRPASSLPPHQGVITAIPERTTGSQAALDRELDRLRPFHVRRRPVDDDENAGPVVLIDHDPW